jgi:hypothetical protein
MSLVPPPVWFIWSAGMAQIVLSLGSLSIPRVLGWPEETRKLRPLTRQVFWSYAGYICISNLCFGLLSVILPESLVNGTSLAAAVTGFIALWWAARVVIQFTYFDRSDAPKGTRYLVAEGILVLLFLCLMIVYGAAAYANLKGIR